MENGQVMSVSPKLLISNSKIYLGRLRHVRPAAALMAVATLCGCISSTAPLLTEAKPILGQQGQIHVFSDANGAREHSILRFRWNGSRYLVEGRSPGFSDFTAHPYEGRDLIVQSTAAKAPRPTEYALARRLAEGVYLVMAIDEEDADPGTRQKFCTRTQGAACRVTTPEQLFVFARATAGKEDVKGAVVVIMAPGRR